MRLFVAVNPGEHLTEQLDTWLDEHRGRFRISWTRPAAWHLTLMFLGPWPAERHESLVQNLQTAVEPLPAFTVQPGGLGAFPGPRRPRVLFLHQDGGKALPTLAAAVRGAVDRTWPDGPQDRKEFRPHLTLARIKHPLPPNLAQDLVSLDPGPLPAFPVNEALLMASELHPTGARYTVQARLPLSR